MHQIAEEQQLPGEVGTQYRNERPQPHQQDRKLSAPPHGDEKQDADRRQQHDVLGASQERQKGGDKEHGHGATSCGLVAGLMHASEMQDGPKDAGRSQHGLETTPHNGGNVGVASHEQGEERKGNEQEPAFEDSVCSQNPVTQAENEGDCGQIEDARGEHHIDAGGFERHQQQQIDCAGKSLGRDIAGIVGEWAPGDKVLRVIEVDIGVVVRENLGARGDRHECRDTGGDRRHDRRARQRTVGYLVCLRSAFATQRPHPGGGSAQRLHGMLDEHAQPGKHGQEQRQPIDETDRDRAAGGDQAVAAGGPGRLGREGVTLPVDVVGVGDRRVLNDRAEAIFGGRGQIVAPRGWRDLLPIDELPLGLEALALGGVHRRLPANVDQRSLGTVQAARRERQGEGEQAQGEGSDQLGVCHRLSVNRYKAFRRWCTGRRSP